jgi:hypothetical protein
LDVSATPNSLTNLRIKLVVGLLTLCATQGLCAEIIAEALLVFPAQTELLEYDNLAFLRNLPNYTNLRLRFSGTVLQQAKLALTELDIPEDQVDEIVLGTTPAATYGLVSGSFNGSLAAKIALKKGIFPLAVNHDELFCPGAGICLLFLENSLAAFGTSGQLRTMLEARQGVLTRLTSNRSLVALINKTDPRAPVRGVALGSQLNAVIASAFQDATGKEIDWLRYSNAISTFGYSVNLDSKAHVSATLECKTSMAAAMLRQMLSAWDGLQWLAVQAGKDPFSMPFQNMQVSSSDRIIELKMDASIPNS